MASIKKLLLPYAYNSAGKLVHINAAHKSETYKCPECGKILSLNISKIPEGEKYHRRNHFSHPKGSPDNHCSESFLHKLFKQKAAEFIRQKTIDNESEFWFTWECNECDRQHTGNMLKKTKTVCLEYDLGNFRPDIALLDRNNKVVIVVEIVVTHKPTPEAIAFYNTHGIACLQINVSDFEDCESIEEKLAHPNCVNLCPTPTCKKCGHKMYKAKMVIVKGTCRKCGKDIKVAMIDSDCYGQTYNPEYFTVEEVGLANNNGAFITMNYNTQKRHSYFANSCKHCKTFIGRFHMYDYYYTLPEIELDLGYKCYKCIEKAMWQRVTEENELDFERKLRAKLQKDGQKFCPKCGNKLILRKSSYKYFYGCKSFPHCHYTESFVLEE